MRTIESMDVLDWYDGIVLAVVRLSWRDGYYLASLLSWFQRERQRIYALIPLGAEEVEEISRLAKGDWGELVAGLRRYGDGAAGRVAVVTVDEIPGEVVREDMIDVERIRGHLIGDIEQALSAPFIP